MQRKITTQGHTSEKVSAARLKLFELFANRPMPDEELLVNLTMYMRSGLVATLLMMDELYQKIIDIPGYIFEFGTWYGSKTVLFENLRAVHEPYNGQRKIVAFDTFEGYLQLSNKDVRGEIIKEGTFATPVGYEKYLSDLLDYHEKENVLSHIKKHSVIKGDAAKTSKKYLDDNQHVLIALAYFDMALYEPTLQCLKNILPRMIKGSIIVCDEICNHEYPGETIAMIEALGIRNYKINRSKYLPDRAFITID